MIDKPKQLGNSLAYVFQIECRDLDKMPFRIINQESVQQLNAEAAKRFGATGNGGAIPLP